MTEHDVRAATARELPGYDIFTMTVGDGFSVGLVAATGERIVVTVPKTSDIPEVAVDMLRVWLEEEPGRVRTA